MTTSWARRTTVACGLALLLAAIHWFDHFAGYIGWSGPLSNSVPFLVLSGMAILSRPSQEV